MAVLSAPTVIAQGTDPGYRYVLLAFRNVTTGDTYDVVSYMSKVFGAIALSPTLRTQVPTVSAIAGTVVTVSTTGLAGDGVQLYVVGD